MKYNDLEEVTVDNEFVNECDRLLAAEPLEEPFDFSKAVS